MQGHRLEAVGEPAIWVYSTVPLRDIPNDWTLTILANQDRMYLQDNFRGDVARELQLFPTYRVEPVTGAGDS